MRGRGAVVRPGGGVLLALAAGACGPPATPPGLDLAGSLAQARVIHESGALDIGTLAARWQLLEGWSRDTQTDEGWSVAWGLGERSTLRLDVAVPRDLELWFRCRAFAPHHTPPQVVRFRLNDVALGEVELALERDTYRVALPAAALRAGANELELHYAWSRRPSELWPESTDDRELAVAWDAVEVVGATPTTPPRAARGALFVPMGSALEYTLEAHPGARFSLEALEGATGHALEVSAASRTGRAVTRVPAGSGAFELELPLDRPGWVALRLQAVWTGETPSPGEELRLVAPGVRGEPPRAPREEPGRAATPAPNVLLYVADTLRADHLGCYGHGGGLTPRLDALAAESLLFENAVAASAWTRTSMASVLTGLPPLTHGANRRDQALGPGLVTLAERLRDAGWDTAGFVTNPNLAPEFGFDQGFDHYAFLEQPDERLAYVDSAGLNRAALAWLDARAAGERPFFLYLHSMDPHDPYFAHEGTAAPAGDASAPGSIPFMRGIEYGRIPATPQIRQELLGLYSAEVRHNDARIGELLDALAERGLDGDTAVVFLSDHGEEFGDHGWWRHGKRLFEEMLDVPLLVRWPDRRHAGRRSTAPARHVDLVPTLLDLLGLPGAEGLPGRSLVAELGAEAGGPPVPAGAWLDLDGRVAEAVILDEWKLIRSLARAREQPRTAIYHLGRDPGETRNLAGEEGVPAELLSALLASPRLAGRSSGPATTAEIDEELRKRLEAVGYLH